MRISWFILVLVVLFTLELLGPVREYVILPFTGLIASISAAVTQLFDSSVQSHGIILQNVKNGTAVSIQPCFSRIRSISSLIDRKVSTDKSWKRKTQRTFNHFFSVGVIESEAVKID